MTRYNSIFIIILSFLIVPLISCRSSDTEVSDESATLDLSFEKVSEWTISDPSIIPLPGTAKVLADESLVIVDHSLNTINHFDESGQLIKTIGGEGRGPGEYQNVSAVAIHSDGRVAVADISSAAITVSDIYSDHRVRRTIDPGWNMALQWAGDKLVYSAHPFSIMADNSGDIIMMQSDSSLENGEEFMRLELQRDDPPEDQISCMFCRFWFRDDLTFYTTPNDHRYLAYFVTPETGESFKVSREEIGPEEYSDRELEQIVEQRREASSRVGIELDTNDLPRFKRMIVDMFIDHKNRLWIQRHSSDESSTVFDLFDSDHQFLGSVIPPEGVPGILSTSGNRILFSQSGPDDDPDTWSAAVYEIVEINR